MPADKKNSFPITGTSGSDVEQSVDVPGVTVLTFIMCLSYSTDSVIR